MTTSLKRLQSIDQREKHLVRGYIREHEHTFKSEEYNIFNNIPDSIPCWCILYYAVVEYFKQIGIDCTATLDRSTLVKGGTSLFSKNYGAILISPKDEYIYKWNLKMITVQTGHTSIIVGIASTMGQNEYTMAHHYCIYSNYGWCQDEKETYYNAVKYFSDDKIDIELNTISKEIKFYRNGEQQDCFKVKGMSDECMDCKYRFAVGIYDPQTEVSLVGFERQYLE